VCSRATHNSLIAVRTAHTARARACVHARACACVTSSVCVCVYVCVCADDSQQPRGCTHQHTTCPCARVCMCGYVYTCMCVYVCMHADDSQQPQGLAHHTHSTCDCAPPSTPPQPKPPPPRFCNRDTAKARAVFSRAAVSDICVAVCCGLFQCVKHKVCTPWKSEKWGLLQQRWALWQKWRFGGKGVGTWETSAYITTHERIHVTRMH